MMPGGLLSYLTWLFSRFSTFFKRWLGALNPTYEYGAYKHHQEGVTPTPPSMTGSHSEEVDKHGNPSMVHSASNSGRHAAEPAGSYHGHKADLLFAPLPEPEETAPTT